MELNESFGYILNSTGKNITRKMESKIKKYGVTTSQWAVLKVISKENNLTQAEVAVRLSADRATTGAVIDKLVDKKLIYKNQCEDDRRAYRVCISDYGVEIADKVTIEAIKCNNVALDGFKDEEINEFLNYFHRVNKNLNREGK